MFDKNETDVIDKIVGWGENNSNIRLVILTSSRVAQINCTDLLSDYDIEIYAENLVMFNNDNWLNYFGKVLIKWPLTPGKAGFSKNHITRLVVFDNFPRIDFQIANLSDFNPSSYDNGYKILVDKHNIKPIVPPPTYNEFTITKPAENEFIKTVNGFYWDIPYISKSLKRGEYYFAKYMLDSAIRYGSFELMLNWYIGLQNNWQVSVGNHGRSYEKLLEQKDLKLLNQTYASVNKQDIQKSMNNMASLFDHMCERIAYDLNYSLSEVNRKGVIEYCNKISNIEL
ncbi:aminoglycoside 6-adenylyltransferase [Candidatus Saccharibacteria bacterium]|nr:aminoglycoside 6-adenylyltransferase [Candidatus Saccharibacteria bacterium]MBP7834964.1 aminoglycoside 6-adenylyltransferase [Candidatus Saccharibacteria bacterium]